MEDYSLLVPPQEIPIQEQESIQYSYDCAITSPNQNSYENNDFDDSQCNPNSAFEIQEQENGAEMCQPKRIPIAAKQEMKFWLMNHLQYPYPSKNVINMFARKYNLTENKVLTFFTYRRSKLLHSHKY